MIVLHDIKFALCASYNVVGALREDWSKVECLPIVASCFKVL